MRFFAAFLVLAGPLAAQQCNFTVDPLNITLPLTASTGNKVTVNAPDAPCNQRWAPSFNALQAPWLTIPAADQAVHTGTGTFTFSVEANPYGFNRTTDISVNNGSGIIIPVHVTQLAPPCKFGLTPTSLSFPVAGGPGSLNVEANCAWAAQNNASFVTMSGAGGFSSAIVKFTVNANGCVAARTGTINVATSVNTTLVSNILQEGSSANFSLSANSASADSAAGDNRFTVTTGQFCGWSASSDVSWMTIISGASGSGNGAISYHLVANTSAARTGSIHVKASPTTEFVFTVTQQAPAAPVPVLNSVNNAASYATDAVSPGEIVTLFGNNLGPTPLAPLQISGGALTTMLAGTQVLFDGVPAPMIYSFRSQVSAVAPYGLAGKSSTDIQVSYNGTVSNAVTMPVQPATPGIFTLDASGLGPGAILNQNLSINGSALPAARGSVVSIYCTGGGVTDPATADGVVVGTTLPRLTLPVTVTIGGINAKVLYAGGVPSSIAGLTQINAEVPASVTPGSKVPVVVKIGDATSVSGVTMAVN